MKRPVLILLSLLLSLSCDSYKKYSDKYRAFFSCDISQSPFNQLTTPGRFLSVRKSDGKLTIVDIDGKKYDEPLSAVQNGSFILSLSGLIIGTPLFNDEVSSVWAYDLGCPECDNPSTRLKFDQEEAQFIVTCTKCKGKWLPNSSGTPINIEEREYRPLYRYPTTLNNGILTVSN